MSSTYGFRVLEMEIRKLKRALWLARAERTEVWKLVHYSIHLTYHSKMAEKWEWVERKCREKAEESSINRQERTENAK